jgi:hypothetical protein
MTSSKVFELIRCSAFVVLATCLCPFLFAQGPLPDAPVPSASVSASAPAPTPTPAVSPILRTPTPEIEKHRFWDKENSSLFAVSAALSAADFAVTRANLQSGGRELNPLVRVFGRSTPGLAANFAGESAGLIGVSYFFHKTGHHKLERAVSMVNITASAGAVSFGLAHR